MSRTVLEHRPIRGRKIWTHSTTTRDRICKISGKFLHWIFECSPVDVFPFSPVFLRNLVRKSPQNVEKIARIPGREKGAEYCHVSGCHGFFRSRKKHLNFSNICLSLHPTPHLAPDPPPKKLQEQNAQAIHIEIIL